MTSFHSKLLLPLFGMRNRKQCHGNRQYDISFLSMGFEKCSSLRLGENAMLLAVPPCRQSNSFLDMNDHACEPPSLLSLV